jgi:hypothetical protein
MINDLWYMNPFVNNLHVTSFVANQCRCPRSQCMSEAPTFALGRIAPAPPTGCDSAPYAFQKAS